MKIGKGAYTPSLKKEELRTSEYAENQQSANNAWRYTRSASNDNKSNTTIILRQRNSNVLTADITIKNNKS